MIGDQLTGFTPILHCALDFCSWTPMLLLQRSVTALFTWHAILALTHLIIVKKLQQVNSKYLLVKKLQQVNSKYLLVFQFRKSRVLVGGGTKIFLSPVAENPCYALNCNVYF